MIDLLVFTALAAAIVFTAAWVVSPKLRQWIERPKYIFQKRLKELDR